MIGLLATPVPSSARRSQHASTVYPTSSFIGRHTNSILQKKCLPTYTTPASPRVWVKRHLAAHSAKRRTCLPAHNDGWNCIKEHEASWYDTGDPYWGGLQMHPGWGGVYHASTLTPLQQKWLAEHELNKQPYSQRHSWIAGQWPISHLSCMQYF